MRSKFMFYLSFIFITYHQFKFQKLYNVAFWIGLHQISVTNGFVWSDGSPLNFINWSGGQPDDYFGGEDCVEIWQKYGSSFPIIVF